MATEGRVTGERQRRFTRYIDMWAMAGIHPTNIDLLNKLKSADDRQFSSNMDVTGKAFDEDREERTREESHLFGIRTDIWRPSKEDRERALSGLQRKRGRELRKSIKKNGRLNGDEKAVLDEQIEADETMSLSDGDVDKSRLVLKMFKTTGSRIRWKGTLEELTVREIHNSLGSKKPLSSFAVVLPDYEYLIYIQQNRVLWRIPPTYSFAYYQESTDRMWYIDMSCYWVSMGIDYRIEAQGRKIGVIDGRLFALGTDSRVKIFEPSLAEDSKFMDLMSLFAASIGFQRQVRSHIRRRVDNIMRGQSVHVVEDEELWLLKNPRRMVR